MKRLPRILMAIVMLAPSAAAPARAGAEMPTAREMYVGCYLFARGVDVPVPSDPPPPYSAVSCALSAHVGIESERMRPREQQLFCPPPATTNPEKKLALAYLDFYEAGLGAKGRNLNGVAAMRAAALVTWPCPRRE